MALYSTYTFNPPVTEPNRRKIVTICPDPAHHRPRPVPLMSRQQFRRHWAPTARAVVTFSGIGDMPCTWLPVSYGHFRSGVPATVNGTYVLARLPYQLYAGFTTGCLYSLWCPWLEQNGNAVPVPVATLLLRNYGGDNACSGTPAESTWELAPYVLLVGCDEGPRLAVGWAWYYDLPYPYKSAFFGYGTPTLLPKRRWAAALAQAFGPGEHFPSPPLCTNPIMGLWEFVPVYGHGGTAVVTFLCDDDEAPPDATVLPGGQAV